MLEFLLDPNTIIAFLTLAALEIVLGIDNIIFISVLFPLPFLPTIPIRSPSDMPSDTRSRSARISKAFETSSKLRRLRAMETERTFQL